MARNTKENIAPIRLELLITIVNRRKAEYYTDLLQSFDVNMQMAVQGRGTAEAKMLEYLGLSGNEKAVILSIVREDRLNEIEEVLSNRFRTIRDGSGIAAAIPLTSVMGASAFGFLSNIKGENI
ncbi:MAG: hypothetical protein IKN80_09760 [Clostridiales bacterium]|nr:hypothetical protein [Clostridiales bacterium]